MKFTRIKILDNYFFIGFDEYGYTFIGSPNGSKNEINKWFSDNKYVLSKNSFQDIKKEITNYLLNKTQKINVNYHLIGTTFELAVWKKVLEIPYSKTKTYKEIAVALGSINKTRAVAKAIAKNPLLMIIPCHRVIGSDGSLKGFRGGLNFKKKLLELEENKNHL